MLAAGSPCGNRRSVELGAQEIAWNTALRGCPLFWGQGSRGVSLPCRSVINGGINSHCPSFPCMCSEFARGRGSRKKAPGKESQVLRSSFDVRVGAPMASTAPWIPSVQNSAWHAERCASVFVEAQRGTATRPGHPASLWGTASPAEVSCLLQM